MVKIIRILSFITILLDLSWAELPAGFDISLRPLCHNAEDASIDCVILFDNQSEEVISIRGVSLLDQYVNDATRDFCPRMVVRTMNSAGVVAESTVDLYFNASLVSGQSFGYGAEIKLPETGESDIIFVTYRFIGPEKKIDILLNKRAGLGPTVYTVNPEMGKPKDVDFSDSALGGDMELTFSNNGRIRYKYVK